MAVWILAVVLGGSLFWVLPGAASSRRLAHDVSEVRTSLSRESAKLDQANQAVASLQAQLEAAQATGDKLVAQARKNQDRIANLNEQIASLRGPPSPSRSGSRTP